MKAETVNEIKGKGAALCLLAAPALMLAGDAVRYWAGAQRAGLVMFKLSFAFFVGAALGMVGLTRGRADGAGLLGGALAVVGCLSGSAIVTANVIFQSFDAAALGEAAERALETALRNDGVPAVLFHYPLPGLAFPAGFLVLAYALRRARAASAPAALLVAVGALLFPVGRIGGIEAAVMGSGLALTLGMALTALGTPGLRAGVRARPSGAGAALEGRTLAG